VRVLAQYLRAHPGDCAEARALHDGAIELMAKSAPLHDIGKIAIPDAVLMKPGPLDEHERRRMQLHPQIGFDLLKDSQNRLIQAGARIALHHHERYDGRGYPQGLSGTEIPIEARVVTVADVFDALISPRPYKEAWSIQRALEYIGEQSGKLLDPNCVQALLDNLPRLYEICDRYSHVAPRPGFN
jgi:two-component system response regulator RpfG